MNELSDAFTHKINYKDGDSSLQIGTTKEEADKALAAWNNWRPVPIPNNHPDAKRSPIFISPKSVALIKRYRYI